MKGILVCLGIILLVSIILNFWNFNGLKSSKETSISDERYYELKAQQQFLIGAVTLGFGVLVFLGYTSKENVEREISTSVNKKMEEFVKTASISAEKAKQIAEELEVIKKKQILRQDLYLVEGLPFDPQKIQGPNGNESIFYFKNLKSIDGEILPSFNKSPFIIINSNSGATLNITDVTKECFSVFSSAYTVSDTGESSIGTFNVLISAIP